MSKLIRLYIFTSIFNSRVWRTGAYTHRARYFHITRLFQTTILPYTSFSLAYFRKNTSLKVEGVFGRVENRVGSCPVDKPKSCKITLLMFREVKCRRRNNVRRNDVRSQLEEHIEVPRDCKVETPSFINRALLVSLS